MKINLNSPDGNAFAIMAKVRGYLRAVGQAEKVQSYFDGPALASVGAPPDRTYRPLLAHIHLRSGKLVSARLAPTHNWGAVTRNSDIRLYVNLQPVWMQSPNHGSRGGTTTSLIIVHHTGGVTIQGALSTFLGGAVTSAHYVIDVDGNIIKMVQDTRRANQAGRSPEARWQGSRGLNSKSIGIEIVHQSGDYPAAQYTALLGLLDRLLAHHAGISDRDIVGHSDVGTNASGRLGRKSTDPGLTFEWTKLENKGWGLVVAVGPQPSSIYGGFFDVVPTGSLRRNDNDSTNRFGAAVRTGVSGAPVHEIQEDLRDIGYSVGTPDGDYGEKTQWAVQMFQEHFFAGGRGGTPNGQVDLNTAAMIKSVG